MSAQFDFTDRVVLVTGASGSLGTAVVEGFHDAGAVVCTSARHPPDDDALSSERERIQFYEADFTDESSVEDVFDAVLSDHGRLDAVCALVGAWRGGTPLDRTATDDFEFVLDVNLRSVFLTAKHAVPRLRETDGAFVSVSARSSLTGGKGDGPYRAAKAGVRLLTESMAEENAGTVRANTVMPSTIDTPANREMFPDADHDSWPTPEEIARVVQFLCSDAASVTSGAAVPVYGET